MLQSISSEGKEYISAIRAAKKTGYASDYIGQLCRAKKIPAQLIGRTWYVDFASLVEHKKHRQFGKVKKLFVSESKGLAGKGQTLNTDSQGLTLKSETLDNLNRLKFVRPADEHDKNFLISSPIILPRFLNKPIFTYENDDRPRLPELSKKIRYVEPLWTSALTKQAVALTLSLLVAISAGFLTLEHTNTKVAMEIRQRLEDISSAPMELLPTVVKSLSFDNLQFTTVKKKLVAAVSFSDFFSNLVDGLQTSFRNLKQIALDKFFFSSAPPQLTYVAPDTPPTSPSSRALTNYAPSINLGSLKSELKSELESYVRTQISAIRPLVVYTSAPGSIATTDFESFRTNEVLPDIHYHITNQSNSDVERNSINLSNITDGGTFTNASISNSTFSGSSVNANTLSFTNADGVSATTTNLFSTNATFTNLFGVTLGLTDFSFTSATGTSATTTNFFSTTASSTNLFSSLLTVAGNGLIVDSSRNVGIGTSTPFGNGLFTVGTSSTNFYIDRASGNVGIGTTTPESALSVVGGISATGLTMLGDIDLNNFSLKDTSRTRMPTYGIGNIAFDNYYDGFSLSDYSLKYITNDLPVVTSDLSGVAYSGKTNTLFGVKNTVGSETIYEFNIDGTWKRTITLVNFLDPEGIAWMYGDTFAVVQERTAAPYLVIITIGPTTTTVDRSDSITITPNITITDNKGMEGVTYDVDNNIFYVAVEKQANASAGGRVFSVTIGGVATELTTLGTALSGAGYTDLGDIYYDRNTKKLFLVAQENNKILETSTTTILSSISTPASFSQPEGISFTPDGSKMFISSEPDDLAVYVRNPYSYAIQINDGNTTTGNVGIGTTTPYSKLSVWGAGTGSGQTFAVVNSASTTLLQVLDNGNVGIGTTSPYAKLSVVGETVSAYFTATTTSNNTFPNLLATNSTTTNATSTNFFATTASSTNLFSSIASLGSLTLGTPLAVTSGGTGQLSFGQGWLHSDGTTLTSSTSPTVAYLTATSTTATSTFAGGLNVAGTSGLTVLQNGRVGIGTTSPIVALSVEQISSNITAPNGKGIYMARGDGGYATIQLNETLGGMIDFSTAGSDQKGRILYDLTNNYFAFNTNSTEKVRINSSGNVGIGTTTPTWLLNPSSATASQLALSAGAGISQWAFRNAGGNLYFATTTVAGTATSSLSALTIDSNGNVGVATTSPAAGFAVATHCVTGDTRLRRRKKRKGGNYDYDEVMIKDVEVGDEILTINENTGKMVWSRVNALMDMGEKQIYKLTTVSGKEIRTTDNHPYLVQKESEKIPIKPKLGVFYDNSNMFYAQKKAGWKIDFAKLKKELSKSFDLEFVNFYTAVPVEGDPAREKTLKYISFVEPFVNLTTKPLKYVKTKKEVNGQLVDIINKKGDMDVEIALDVTKTIDDLDVVFIVSGDSDLLPIKKYATEKGKKIIFASFENNMAWELFYSKHILFDKYREVLALHQENDKKITPKRVLGVALLDIVYSKAPSLSSGGVWTKVKDIKEGNKIGVFDGKKSVWDVITKIEIMPEERVYDIEVEGTHNFIGNDIIAHNTYLGGNLTVQGNTNLLGNSTTTSATTTNAFVTSLLSTSATSSSLFSTTASST
ncbi:MAG: SdiA-regulated domain-containing protein, partial [bacterium]|nr:SdiA-regulated domain-containing protein [bacterium]